ncbi:MAG: ABC transporter ATP-binding protein [Actinomycetota bacterium]|nr:ABC transporter ATP-binding protein [Actinomycetota bacterium]
MMGMRGGAPQNLGAHHSQKKINTKLVVKKMARRFAPDKKWLLIAITFGVVSTIFAAIAPKLLGDAINVIFDGVVGSKMHNLVNACHGSKSCVEAVLRKNGNGQIAAIISNFPSIPNGIDFPNLYSLLTLTFGLYVTNSVLSLGQSYVMAGVAQRATARLRRDVEEKLGRLPLAYFDSKSHGDTMSRVANDIDNISTVIQQGLSQLLTSILGIVIFLIVMIVISPFLAVIAVITVPLALLSAKRIAKSSQGLFVSQWRSTGQINGHIEESYSGHQLIRAFGATGRSKATFDKYNESLYQASYKAQFLSGIVQPMMQFFSNLNFVLIAVVGGYRAAQGAIAFGAVVAFTQYARQFTMPMTQIASQINLLQSGIASADRVFELLDSTEELRIPSTGALSGSVSGRIELRGVRFSYDKATPLIEDLNVVVEAGEQLAIVGPTGAGKTTLVNLLMRFYEIDQGEILIDGVPYSKLGRDEVRSAFAMVLQDSWLFDGTIRENIAYGSNGNDQDIIEAARSARADAFVKTLSHGYETPVTEMGTSLSAGQRQLITIARAIVANPPILILDEATSNVDSRTEMLLQEAMATIRNGRTSFIIAHRLSTIRSANHIIVMRDGRIVEYGNHESLMAADGYYKELYESQYA